MEMRWPRPLRFSFFVFQNAFFGAVSSLLLMSNFSLNIIKMWKLQAKNFADKMVFVVFAVDASKASTKFPYRRQ
jgi:hypothetical protein